MGPIVINADGSKKAQELLQRRLLLWLRKLLAYEGYTEWKNKQIQQTLLAGLIPATELEPLADFRFSEEIEREHPLVAGYYAVLSSVMSVRECEFYFRRYPFGGKNVSREAHLRTCCELFFSRVYQFETRWLRHLTQLSRRTKPKGLPIELLKAEFRSRFEEIRSVRHQIHHEDEYSDIQLKAVGLGDLLSIGDQQFEWLKMSQLSYRQITKDWIARVHSAADQLDLFVGVTATLMLARCEFLPTETEDGTATPLS